MEVLGAYALPIRLGSKCDIASTRVGVGGGGSVLSARRRPSQIVSLTSGWRRGSSSKDHGRLEEYAKREAAGWALSFSVEGVYHSGYIEQFPNCSPFLLYDCKFLILRPFHSLDLI